MARTKLRPLSISLPDELTLIAHALVDYRSVAKAYRGEPMKPLTHERIRRAAKELRLKPPLPFNPGR